LGEQKQSAVCDVELVHVMLSHLRTMCVRGGKGTWPSTRALACRFVFIQVSLLDAAQESGATSAAVTGERKP
jgi:hypothetical protein